MFNFKRFMNLYSDRFTSRLFDETTFYKAFAQDLDTCKEEVIIESPFITSSRIEKLTPSFKKLLNKRIKICIITRDPAEHDEIIRYQVANEILKCSEMGIKVVLLQGNHHRKLAILDRKILWEGSLNILSFNNSLEIMRRIQTEKSAKEMYDFLNLDKVI